MPRMTDDRTTLQQIAAATGVSIWTVNRVLRGKNKENRPSAIARAAEIRAVAERLGYQPSAAAHAIRSGRFRTIGFLSRRDSDYLPGEMQMGIIDHLAAHDHLPIFARLPLIERLGDPEAPRLLRELMVDGLIVHLAKALPPGLDAALRRHHLPLVWLNSRRRHDAVEADNHGAVQAAVAALVAAGHRDIRLLEFPVVWGDETASHESAGDRRAGYAAGMEAAGLVPRTAGRSFQLQPGQAVPWGGAEDDRLLQTRRLLEGPGRPSAVVTVDAESALMVQYAAHGLGLRIPGDLSLTTLSDDAVVGPGGPITTWVIPHREMAQRAVTMVLEMVADGRRRRGVRVPFATPEPSSIAAPAAR